MTSTYGDYMKDRAGWFFGLTGAQLTVVLVAGVPLWVAIDHVRWGWVMVWLPAWAVVAALVVVPVRGWSTAQWLALLASHTVGGLMGWTAWQSKVAAGISDDLSEADLPGVLAGVQIHDGPPYGALLTRVAVIQHHAHRTWAASARIEHPGLGLVEADARDRMGAGLAELCEAATRTELVASVALCVRTVPDDGAEREDWVRAHRTASGPGLSRRVNDQLAQVLTPASVRGEAFVTVVVAEDRIGRAGKRAGGGLAGRARVLYGTLGEVESRLLAAMGATTVTWLDSPALAAAIRTGFEPGDRATLTAADIAHRQHDHTATGVPLAATGPTTASTELRHYTHGEWASITDTILLPDQGAVLGALAPLLVPSAPGERRSLTVFFAPVSARAASRITGREEMSALTGSELRRRSGRLERATERRALTRVQATDEKLTRGRSLVRTSAAVCVTVPTDWPVGEVGRRLDASVRLAGYVPQRLDGAQDSAFAAATIPLGVGGASATGPTVTPKVTPTTSHPHGTAHRTAHRAAGRAARRTARRQQPSRSVAGLLADMGADLARRPVPTSQTVEERLFTQFLPVRGRRARAAGWAAAGMAPLSTWRMTSEQTPVLWPLIAAHGLPPTGAQIGIDLLSGGAFYCDPLGWVKHDDIPVTNPNVFVFGKPGRGKSATVKIFALRMMDFGYRVLILGDTKDEYEALCRALGIEPFLIGHGMGARVNPLDLGPLGHGWDRLTGQEATRRAAVVFNRWLALIRGLVGSQKIGGDSVPFGPSDEAAVSSALRTLTGYSHAATRLRPVTIPRLWAALDDPSDELVTECRYASTRQLYDQTRTLRDALGALVKGHLAGLFDEPTTITPDWRAPIQSLSLSRLDRSGDEAVGIGLLCLNSWGQGMREIADPGDVRIVVRDETWKQMRLGLEPVKTLDSNLRLSRHAGDVQVVVYHKPSDPLSAGSAGSQAVAIAKDLLHLADIRVLHGQDKVVADELGQLLGLNPVARQVVTGWAMGGKGRALWTVGERPYMVEAQMTPLELDLTYTNDALAIA